MSILTLYRRFAKGEKKDSAKNNFFCGGFIYYQNGLT
jgi:hypothetical protein